MSKALCEYNPGDENREDYLDAKRNLLNATVQRDICNDSYSRSDTQFLQERVNGGDYDDNEVDLDVGTDDEMTKLELRFIITDERCHCHPEVDRPAYLLTQPAVTECFHKILIPRQRILIAEVVLGRAYSETLDINDTLKGQRFIELMEERYEDLVRECTIGTVEPRRAFDIL